MLRIHGAIVYITSYRIKKALNVPHPTTNKSIKSTMMSFRDDVTSIRGLTRRRPRRRTSPIDAIVPMTMPTEIAADFMDAGCYPEFIEEPLGRQQSEKMPEKSEYDSPMKNEDSYPKTAFIQ